MQDVGVSPEKKGAARGDSNSPASPVRAVFTAGAIFWLSILSLGAQGYGLTQRPVAGPFLNGAMPRKEQSSTGWAAVSAFPGISFDDPTCFAAEPRTNRLYVGCRQGKIFFFEQNAATTDKTLFLDLTPVTQGYNDSGLLGIAFHPEYGLAGSSNRGYVYVSYCYSPSPVANPGVNPPNETHEYNRLSRFQVPDGSLIADPASETVLINQYDPHVWHNGGGMFFGADGFLYLSNGDGGYYQDTYNTTQEINDGLFSGVLRIDVDMDPSRSHPIRRQPSTQSSRPAGWANSYSQNYFIPNDNPWLDPGGSILEEFYAIGFRSPHRMTYDPPTDRIWMGDVGQGLWEEVDIIEKGGNYQWAFMEGLHAGPKAAPGSLIGTSRPPIYEYAHANGNNAVIGGYVYRGVEHAAFLTGQYIFGDNGSSRIWAMTYNGTGTPQVNLLCVVPNGGTEQTGLASFGVDRDGEIYMCVMGSGTKIYKLAQTGSETAPPPLLSQTGAFTNLATLAPNNSLLPYTVNTPLWSDNAVKFRWMSVPNDGAPYTASEMISFSPTGAWTFPTGTVFVKHFELPIDDTNPALRKRLETRFLVFGTNGYYGLTYKWRADNSDADLLASNLSETNFITTATGIRTQVWYYPNRQDCLICHNPNARSVLGVRTCQLNGDYDYPSTGQTDNQLRALNHIGIFNPAINETNIPAYPRSVAINDTSATLELRVRSYLDANCAQCHRPGGAPAFFDARLDTPLGQQGIVEGPVVNPMGITNAAVVAPRSLTQSLLYVRDNLVGASQMPPLAKNTIDTNYIDVLGKWINSLPPVLAPPIALGNTNNGTQLDNVSASWINAGRFQATTTTPIAALFARVGAITGHYRCALYSDNAGQPSRFLGATAEITNPGAGWQTFPMTTTLTVTNGLFYWLAIWSDNSNAKIYYSGTGGTIRWGSYPYGGTWPDPVVTTGSASLNYCIYALGSSPALTSVAVTPLTSTIWAGGTRQFTAAGTYSDGSVLDLTTFVNWSASNSIVAIVDDEGLATGMAAGSTVISAEAGGKNGAGVLTVQVAPFPNILSFDAANGLITITSSATPGLNYTLQSAIDLPSTNWINLSPPVTASGTTVTFTNAVGEDAMRFYRVMQTVP
jgi:uncharacterized repeat protein (TIGR03806 family)